jgi:hypothetical protein
VTEALRVPYRQEWSAYNAARIGFFTVSTRWGVYGVPPQSIAIVSSPRGQLRAVLRCPTRGENPFTTALPSHRVRVMTRALARHYRVCRPIRASTGIALTLLTLSLAEVEFRGLRAPESLRKECSGRSVILFDKEAQPSNSRKRRSLP